MNRLPLGSKTGSQHTSYNHKGLKGEATRSPDRTAVIPSLLCPSAVHWFENSAQQGDQPTYAGMGLSSYTHFPSPGLSHVGLQQCTMTTPSVQHSRCLPLQSMAYATQIAPAAPKPAGLGASGPPGLPRHQPAALPVADAPGTAGTDVSPSTPAAHGTEVISMLHKTAYNDAMHHICKSRASDTDGKSWGDLQGCFSRRVNIAVGLSCASTCYVLTKQSRPTQADATASSSRRQLHMSIQSAALPGLSWCCREQHRRAPERWRTSGGAAVSSGRMKFQVSADSWPSRASVHRKFVSMQGLMYWPEARHWCTAVVRAAASLPACS